MVKADLIAKVMEAANLEGPLARKAVEALFESLAAALERGDRVVLLAIVHSEIVNMVGGTTFSNCRDGTRVVVA